MKDAYFAKTLQCLLVGMALLLALEVAAQAPAWQVAQLVGQGAAGSSQVYESATDASGNLYLTGVFTGTVSFGSTTLTATGGADVFVARWNPATSTFAWAKQAGGSGSDYGYGIAVSGGNVYISGVFISPTAVFGNTSLVNASSAALSDVFVAKLTEAGVFVWAYRAGSNTIDTNTAVAVSGSSVYLSGSFNGPTANFGSVALSNSSTAYTSEGFVAKLLDAGPSAAFVWAQRFGGAASEDCYGLAVSGSNVYVAGAFAQTAEFGGTVLTSVANTDIYVAKLLDTGLTASFQWAQRAGGGGQDVVNFLTASGSSVYVAGSFNTLSAPGISATFGSTTLSSAATGDAFVAKLTDAGTASSFAWALQAGNQGNNLNGEIWEVKASGSNLFVLGSFSGVTRGFGSTTFSSTGTADIFLTKLLDTGSGPTTAWTQRAGGPNLEAGYALSLSNGTVYVGGYTTGTATFGSHTLPNTGLLDTGFLATLADAAALPTIMPSAQAGGIGLFPNPARSTTAVQLPTGLAAGPATLTLLDAVGRVVRTCTALPAVGTTQTTLDVAGLAPGVYTLRIAVGASLGTTRLVIE